MTIGDFIKKLREAGVQDSDQIGYMDFQGSDEDFELDVDVSADRIVSVEEKFE